MLLPSYFCWSRFGTEAGQPIEEIIARKEQERIANGGMFFWGIGNAVGPSISELLRRTSEPEVLFSPIKSAPRAKDDMPDVVAAWTSADTMEGDHFSLPTHSLVTSRYDRSSAKRVHYALVCFSKAPLAFSACDGSIAVGSLLNLLTARQVGASQVTAVVQRKDSGPMGRPDYPVSMRAKLVYPYYLRLKDPIILSRSDADRDWSSLVHQVWRDKRSKRWPTQGILKIF